MAFSEAPIKVGVYFWRIGSQALASFGESLKSSCILLNSSKMACAGPPPTCGSIGPRLECNPMTMLLQARGNHCSGRHRLMRHDGTDASVEDFASVKNNLFRSVYFTTSLLYAQT